MRLLHYLNGGTLSPFPAEPEHIVEALLILTYTDSDKHETECQLVHAQGQLQLLLYSAPTLHDAIAKGVEKAYQRAKDNVTEDYGLSLPDICPFELNRIVEGPYDRLVAERQTGMNVYRDFITEMSNPRFVSFKAA